MTIAPKNHRLAWLDATRGIALIAMASYHFTWDLELFGYLAHGTAGSGYWKLYARAIASTFLIIVGISLALSHHAGINMRRYIRRTAIVALAATAISVATYLAMPGSFIHFGILHHIAVASIAGLAFVRLPTSLLIILLVLFLEIGQWANFSAFDSNWLNWLGLYETPPRSNDFVPLVPWLSASIAGIILGRLIIAKRATFPTLPFGPPKPLVWLGKRSLAFYLIHQPVLIALVYLAAQIAPPAPKPIIINPEMISACQTSCEETNEQLFCTAYCACAYDAAKNSSILAMPDISQEDIDWEMNSIGAQCQMNILEDSK